MSESGFEIHATFGQYESEYSTLFKTVGHPSSIAIVPHLHLGQIRNVEVEEVGEGEAPSSGGDLGNAVVNPGVMKIDNAIGGAGPADSSEGSPADSDCQPLVDGRVPWHITRSGSRRQGNVMEQNDPVARVTLAKMSAQVRRA